MKSKIKSYAIKGYCYIATGLFAFILGLVTYLLNRGYFLLFFIGLAVYAVFSVIGGIKLLQLFKKKKRDYVSYVNKSSQL